MKIVNVIPNSDWTLKIITEKNKEGIFDVRPYLIYEAFEDLNNISAFMKISNGGYFIEWECGADLSADTIEANMKEIVYSS